MSRVFRKFVPVKDTSKPFDCGNSDLNGFLLETDTNTPNATMYAKELLAETYVYTESETDKIIAYFSILNDKIEREFADNTIWNRLSRQIPNSKRRSSYETPPRESPRLQAGEESGGITLSSGPLYNA